MIYANFRQRLFFFFFFQMEAFESWCVSLRWLSGKESACQCRKSRFDPWVGKISYSRNWHSTPGFLPGKFYRQRSLAGYSPWGSQTVGHDWVHTHCAPLPPPLRGIEAYSLTVWEAESPKSRSQWDCASSEGSKGQSLVASSWWLLVTPWYFLTCTCITPASASSFTWPSPCVALCPDIPLLSLIRTPVVGFRI